MLRKVIFNRIPAAMIIIGFCVITTSGYTFCQIRGAPVKGRDGKFFSFLSTFTRLVLNVRFITNSMVCSTRVAC